MVLSSKTYSNGLTLEQQERIYLLIDSLSSSIESCSRVLLSGYDSPNNRLLLHVALAKVNYSLGLLLKNKDVSPEEIVSLTKQAETWFLGDNKIHYQPGYTDET